MQRFDHVYYKAHMEFQHRIGSYTYQYWPYREMACELTLDALHGRQALAERWRSLKADQSVNLEKHLVYRSRKSTQVCKFACL